ncbi:MAG: CDP-diacylglycerol--glycerol-3-phosphate 3-phosphatidyltransferase [Actinomycetia bacterium]|nr:CDP-diacylglycerol--glycerol-3-phosphate 3-phosphatidyltransferase [Actinomycetes bacterium]MCP4227198.1 CDP-diacylglycerol--glycerol-3-phosphate 3-phosphatidyltransferase [Actinomycetes bacterium]MCP5032800.1 CDP-diacylglycerol--glycerol-3-phosphate 3-phosphatidyltransferase [Actinomycetes bacterium]
MSTAGQISLLGTSRWARAANSLTIFRITMAPVLALLVWYQNPWWLTFWLGWFLGATDAIDGPLARRATPTRLGAFLDPLADKVVVLLLGAALVVVDRFSALPIVLIAIREVAIMAYRSYWSRRGLAIPARKSAKYKTFVQGVAMAAAMCPALDSYLWFADTLLWLAVGFTLVSGLQYVIDGRDALRTTGQR